MQTVRFTVPFTPPSVNHSVRHAWRGHHIQHYPTHEAIAFKNAVATFSRGQSLPRGKYRVKLAIYLGKGERGDIDNLPKCVLDALKGRVIHSDAAVKRLEVDLDRDPQNPRTEIEVTLL